jgi:hypothetical protein
LEERSAYMIFVEIPEEEGPFGKRGRRLEDDIKMNFKSWTGLISSCIGTSGGLL